MHSARLFVLGVGLAGLVGMAPAPSLASAKTARTCYPAHSRTLVASAHARVFETRKTAAHARVTYGCLLTRKRPVKFSLPDFPTGFGDITLAGKFVAYADYSDCAASFCDPNSVVLQDLRSGRTTFADGTIRVGQVTALVLKSDGSLAFIASTFDDLGAFVAGSQVVAVEHGVAPVVLAGGPGIGPDSLALGGSTLYWTQNAMPFSAQLR